MFPRGRFWRNFDWILFGTAILLVATGLLVIYSTSFKAASLAAPVDVRNQVIYASIGLVMLTIAAQLDYRGWARSSTILYGLMLGSLILVKLVGKTALGGTRWINLGFTQFQPSELAKVILIIVLARFLAKNYEYLEQPRYFVLSLVYVAIPLVLVLTQPDLGTGLVFVAIWTAMVLSSRIRKRYVIALGLVALLSIPVAIPMLKPYQRHRIEVFLHPTEDKLGTGYNVNQALVAVGSGQMFGRGLAAGTQSQLNFLPSQHTDFIFAVLAEKLGFVGGLLLLGMFGLLLMRSLMVAYGAQDRFGMFIAVGITAMFLFHIMINIGMNLGIMPVTGIPLPFVSYGGTSLIIGMICIGLLESISLRRKKIEFDS